MTKILPVLGGHDATAQMVAEVLEALRDIQGSSIKRIEDLFAGLTLQLNSLAELLRVLNAPEKIKHMPAEKHDTLAGTLLEVHYVVYQLKNLVFIAKSGVNRRGKLLWGAKSICTGFEIRLKRRLDQFESLKAMLEQQVADLASASASAKAELDAETEKVRLYLSTHLKPSGSAFIPAKLNGTLDWIASHPKITSWTRHPPAQDSDRALCVYGAPGCGKSVLASAISDSLTSMGELAIMFSFWWGHAKQLSRESMLSTILWHLLAATTDEQAIKTKAKLDRSWTSGTLLAEIDSIIGSLGRSVFIIIDGLNEHVDDWKSTSEGLLKTVTDWFQSHQNLHLLLVGREPSLFEALKVFPARLEITRELIQDDLRTFVADKLQQLPQLPVAPSLEVRDIMEILESRPDAMFLWVELIFKEIRMSEDVTDIRACLERLPQDLDDEYNGLLYKMMERHGGSPGSSTPKMEKAKDIMAMVVGAARPLTIDELRWAYAIKSCAGAEWEACLITNEDISEACRDFITISNGLVLLGHSSMEDFLTRPEEQWEERDNVETKFFRVDPADAHRALGLVCIKALQAAEEAARGDEFHSSAAAALAGYASDFWGIHILKSGEPTPEFSEKVLDFLKSPALDGCVERAISGMMQDFQHITTWSAVLDVLQWCGRGSGSDAEAVMPKLWDAFGKGFEKHKTSLEELDDFDADWVKVAKEHLENQGKAEDMQVAASSSSGQELRTLDAGGDMQELSHFINGIVLNSATSNKQRQTQLIATMKSTIAKFDSLLDSFRDLWLHAVSSMFQIPAPIAVVMGFNYMIDEEYDRAISVFENSLKRIEGRKNGWEPVLLSLMGFCYSAKDNREVALVHLDRARMLAESIRMPFYETLSSLCSTAAAVMGVWETRNFAGAEKKLLDTQIRPQKPRRLRHMRIVPLESRALGYAKCVMNITLAELRTENGRYDAALETLQEVEAFFAGDRHLISTTFVCKNQRDIATVLQKQGKEAEAARVFSSAMEKAEKRYGVNSRERFEMGCKHARFLMGANRLEETKAELAALKKMIAAGKFDMASSDFPEWCVGRLCKVLVVAGECGEAAQVRTDVGRKYEKLLGEKHRTTLNNLECLAREQLDCRQFEPAAVTVATLLARLDVAEETDRLAAMRAHDILHRVKYFQEDYPASEAECWKYLALAQEAHGESHRDVADAYCRLAGSLQAQEKYNESGAAYIATGTLLVNSEWADRADRAQGRYQLACGHYFAGSWNTTEVESALRELLTMTEECPVAFEWTRMVCLCLLGNILRDINRHVLAVPVLDEGVLLAQKAVKRHGDERDEWGRARAAAALRMMDEKLKNSRELVSKNKEPAECGDNEGDMRPWVLLPIN